MLYKTKDEYRELFVNNYLYEKISKDLFGDIERGIENSNERINFYLTKMNSDKNSVMEDINISGASVFDKFKKQYEVFQNEEYFLDNTFLVCDLLPFIDDMFSETSLAYENLLTNRLSLDEVNTSVDAFFDFIDDYIYSRRRLTLC